MGCNSSQPAGAGAGAAKGQEPKGTPSAKKLRHHADLGIIMCPYFKVDPKDSSTWWKNADEFCKTAQETEDLIAYSMGFNDGMVHIRQGYRTAEALQEHLRTADHPMAEALRCSTLEKVELHGPRKQVNKIRRQMTKLDYCAIDFFYTPNHLKNFRRPTEYAGQNADKLVHFDVSLEVSIETIRQVKPRLKELHRVTRDNAGNESFGVSYCAEKGLLYLMASFDATEAVVEHFFSVQAQLGEELWAKCVTQLLGPDSEVQKLKKLLEKSGAAAKKTLSDMAKAGASDLKAAMVYTQSAAKAAEQGLADGVKEARDVLRTSIDRVQERAEELGKEVYRKAMSLEGAAKASAKATAKFAYKRAIAAAHQLRQDTDQAAISAYSAAMDLGGSAQDALTKAREAAEATARSLHDEILGVKEAAEAAHNRAVEAMWGAAEASKAELEELARRAEDDVDAARLAFDLNVVVLENVLGTAAENARESMMGMWEGIKNTASELVNSMMAKQVETKSVTVEYVERVKLRTRDAAWTVLIAKQHVYLVTYETQVSLRKSGADAIAAASEAADLAADRALALFRSGEQLAADAVKAAEALVAKAGKAAEAFWASTTTFALNTEKSLRYSMHKAAASALEDVDDAAFEVRYRVNSLIEALEEEAEEMHDSVQGRVESWWDALQEAEVAAMKRDAADKERRRRACC